MGHLFAFVVGLVGCCFVVAGLIAHERGEMAARGEALGGLSIARSEAVSGRQAIDGSPGRDASVAGWTAEAAEGDVRIGRVEIAPSGPMTFSGTSRPGERVILRTDGDVLGRVRADSSGNWSLRVDRVFPHGDHSVRAGIEDDGTVRYGGRVNISIPPSFREMARAIVVEPPPRSEPLVGERIASEAEAARAQRRAAEDLARAANEAFTEWQREQADRDKSRSPAVIDSLPADERRAADDARRAWSENESVRRAAEERARLERERALLERELRERRAEEARRAAEEELLRREAEALARRREAEAAERARQAGEEARRRREAEADRARQAALEREDAERAERQRQIVLAQRHARAETIARLFDEARAVSARRVTVLEGEALPPAPADDRDEDPGDDDPGDDERSDEAGLERRFERARRVGELANKAFTELAWMNRQNDRDRDRGDDTPPQPARRPTDEDAQGKRRGDLEDRFGRANRIGRLADEAFTELSWLERQAADGDGAIAETPLPDRRGEVSRGENAPLPSRVPYRNDSLQGARAGDMEDDGFAPPVRGAGRGSGWRSDPNARCRGRAGRVLARLPGTYTVAYGDTLWGISQAHYGAGYLYRRIYGANRRVIRDPHWIYPCERLTIPARRSR